MISEGSCNWYFNILYAVFTVFLIKLMQLWWIFEPNPNLNGSLYC